MQNTSIFVTGEQTSIVSLQEELIESHLTTDELLSVLPLNLFLPDLPSEKKKTLVEHNEEIKEKFEVSNLTDWAFTNYTPEEIGSYLQQNYFPNDSETEWIENAKMIVEKSENISESLS